MRDNCQSELILKPYHTRPEHDHLIPSPTTSPTQHNIYFLSVMLHPISCRFVAFHYTLSYAMRTQPSSARLSSHPPKQDPLSFPCPATSTAKQGATRILVPCNPLPEHKVNTPLCATHASSTSSPVRPIQSYYILGHRASHEGLVRLIRATSGTVSPYLSSIHYVA